MSERDTGVLSLVTECLPSVWEGGVPGSIPSPSKTKTKVVRRRRTFQIQLRAATEKFRLQFHLPSTLVDINKILLPGAK